MRRESLAVVGSVLALAAGSASGEILWSTGDLGNNVINDAGDFFVFPELEDPDPTQTLFVNVKYGLWNSPDVTVSVYVNDLLVGDFVADQGYIVPGPEYVSYDVTGLLVDGTNEVYFTGFGANSGDYVVGMVDVDTEPVPAPATMALLGLAGVTGLRRRR